MKLTDSIVSLQVCPDGKARLPRPPVSQLDARLHSGTLLLSTFQECGDCRVFEVREEED